MSYSATEASRDDARPFFLYAFTRGAETFRFASVEREVSAFGETFEPSAISHGKIETGGTIKRDTLEVVFPPGDAFALSQLGIRGPEVTTLTIWRNHVGLADTEARVIFKGRVIAGKPSPGQISITCSTLYSLLREPGLNRRFLRTCDHVLYGPRCKASRAAFSVAGTVTATDGITHTVAAAAGQPNGYFAGGIVTFGTVSGFIVRHEGNLIRTRGPIPGLVEAVALAPASVSLAPGCDRSRATCLGRFNNLANFGGFPFIPQTNPFGGTSSF